MTALASQSPAAAPPAAPNPAAPAGSALPVTFSALGRSFGSGGETHQVLRDITFDVHAGEVLAILGSSGCGKSTLLRAAAGLDAPTAGEVLINGTPVRGIDDRCAVAFQEPRLLPWQTLQANIAMGLPKGISARNGKAKVAELLELVELTAFAKHRPRAVSGGMAQRASLARALARTPGVLLLDEPFGALDALTRLKMQDLLLSVHRATPTTVLLVTHDVDEALQLADRIIILGKEPGKHGATITDAVTVPGTRPRDRSSAELARMRGELLARLGVDRH
ncbi:ABC transporter ATP-binding protein [Arthrobacter sp. APC 3897]|uniref:ABC transporter ATP-binding protein n=1 Tax=Arthrobacter sp. APC 3897 TaxID=3035204 RepID=UPI0025B3B5BB|nr:ABC transporter ATP-binding protein [Arthrobacter sp. APC 3897]MDN3481292.1 ABC transporter ATP-binding protein [Arthrobacter sp. APC 3897]